MELRYRILFITQVAARLGVSVASVNRYLALRRKGIGTFPLPISPFKGRGRWLESDIDRYVESLSSVNVANAMPITNAEQQRGRKNKEQRRKSVESASARLGLKNAKGTQKPQ